jgi:hypothetical protein
LGARPSCANVLRQRTGEHQIVIELAVLDDLELVQILLGILHVDPDAGRRALDFGDVDVEPDVEAPGHPFPP